MLSVAVFVTAFVMTFVSTLNPALGQRKGSLRLSPKLGVASELVNTIQAGNTEGGWRMFWKWAEYAGTHFRLYSPTEWLSERIIRATKNDIVNGIKNIIQEIIPGEEKIYMSIDILGLTCRRMYLRVQRNHMNGNMEAVAGRYVQITNQDR
ncbi:hypothetical protein EVAR_15768_1 [Eumeta japonica]|uniref:Uncharacterized protein n=1 Tax=Eumeta variegata TaxID=151549 RepID=A0A4C1TZK9_EUMVA|nr:hypothetical protein EVAR_15768_1 [Eumeta japonica]